MPSTSTLFSSLSFAALLLPVGASAFSDVTSANVHADAIAYVQSENIVQGYSDGTFRADATINRAEFTKIIVGATMKTTMDMHCFPDVQTEWYAPFVCTAKMNDVIGGYADGTFRPQNSVTFVEGAKIIARSFHIQSTDTDGNWYTPFVLGLAAKNAIPTDITALSQPLTRGQMAEMIFRIRSQITDKPSKTYEQLSGRAFVSVQTADSTSSASSKKSVAASSAAAAGAFPYNLRIDSHWQTFWNLQKIEGTDESIKNVSVENDDARFSSYLRVKFPQGSVDRFSWKFYKLPLGGLYVWAQPAITPQKNMTLTYYVRVPTDFDVRGGGALPGLLTGMQNGRRQESAGSVDLYWDKQGFLTVEGGFQSKNLIHTTTAQFPHDGEWHRIDIAARMQTAIAKSNGSLQVSLDGKVIAGVSDVNFMNRTDDLWDGISLQASLYSSDATLGAKKDWHMDFAGFSLDSDE